MRGRSYDLDDVWAKLRSPHATPAAIADFFALLDRLGSAYEDQFGSLGALPLKDGVLNTYTASFGGGVVMFKVAADQPVIIVLQITWAGQWGLT
ncbi:MAG TPA: hypothetical protein VG015_08225 [Candidatus Dormibacteraeota bacterium]|nr:hypothetical protein [Candidatus Dormibacteraeota bacterium]